MNVQSTAPPGQVILNVSSAPPPQSYSSVPVAASSSLQLSATDIHKIPVRSTSGAVQRLPSNVVYAPIASTSGIHRQPRDLLQKRLMGHMRSPRLPKNKSYQKRRHALPHRLEELRKALDLTKYIEQVQNIINQPIK